MAAYRSSEPTYPHELWQHTDAARFPGLDGGVDGNVFHGTHERFLAVMRPGSVGPPKPKPPPGAVQSMASVLKRDDAPEVFVELTSSQILTRRCASAALAECQPRHTRPLILSASKDAISARVV